MRNPDSAELLYITDPADTVAWKTTGQGRGTHARPTLASSTPPASHRAPQSRAPATVVPPSRGRPPRHKSPELHGQGGFAVCPRRGARRSILARACDFSGKQTDSFTPAPPVEEAQQGTRRPSPTTTFEPIRTKERHVADASPPCTSRAAPPPRLADRLQLAIPCVALIWVVRYMHDVQVGAVCRHAVGQRRADASRQLHRSMSHALAEGIRHVQKRTLPPVLGRLPEPKNALPL